MRVIRCSSLDHCFANSSVVLLGLVLAVSARAESVCLPNGDRLESVDFDRHVIPLLSRLGCNSGSCHGSFQGRGGFRLSLFGHEPTEDFLAIARGELARRIDPIAPERSLFLLKPTGAVAHGGGTRLSLRSWQYNVLLQWIAKGAKRATTTGHVRAIEVSPTEYLCNAAGDDFTLSVQVEFADGSRRDVTPFCALRPQDDSIVSVDDAGVVRALRSGDTAVIVAYGGALASMRVLVAREGGYVTNGEHSAVAENLVDRLVLAKLERLRITPSHPADDAEFLRRIMLDTVGTLPTPAEVREFLADDDKAKRERLIDRLLVDPRHASVWAARLCAIMGANFEEMESPEELQPDRARMWLEWFQRRIAENVPYDEIARGILCATSRNDDDLTTWISTEAARMRAAAQHNGTDYAQRKGLDLFWRRMTGDEFFATEKMAEQVARSLLGVRIDCAQCHKHPYDHWTQTDYRALANVFSQLRFDSSPELRAALTDLLESRRRGDAPHGEPIPRLRELYLAEPWRELADPVSGAKLSARAPSGPECRSADRRAPFADWLVAPANPYFARAFANRVWTHYFGRGLVDPVDAISVANPASNEALLAALSTEFAASGYDIRKLERLILQSDAYQRSAKLNDTNREDRLNHARSHARALRAEVAAEAIRVATGAKPAGFVDTRPSPFEAAAIAAVFSRPPSAVLCDCDPRDGPDVRSTVRLLNDAAVEKQCATGRVADLLAEGRESDEIVDELFLSTLSRFPSSDERAWTHDFVARRPPSEAWAGVLWALINTREFMTNH